MFRAWGCVFRAWGCVFRAWGCVDPRGASPCLAGPVRRLSSCAPRALEVEQPQVAQASKARRGREGVGRAEAADHAVVDGAHLAHEDEDARVGAIERLAREAAEPRETAGVEEVVEQEGRDELVAVHDALAGGGFEPVLTHEVAHHADAAANTLVSGGRQIGQALQKFVGRSAGTTEIHRTTP